MKPLVSVIVGSYNYGRFLADAIESALAQTYRNCEVIVVDDGSEDNSREVICSFGDRIQAIFKPNGGQSSAFNAAFAQSRGELICFLDADDIFLPNKVARVVEGLAMCPQGWCFHHLQWTDSSLGPRVTPPIPLRTGKYDFRAELLAGKCNFAPPATSGLAFSRVLLERIMPIPEAIVIASDNYLKLSSLALEPGYFIAEQYALQRIHGQNVYTGKDDQVLRANVNMSVASGLRARIPAMRSICTRWYAGGIASKWDAGVSISDIYQAAHDELAEMSFAERMEIVARVAYKTARRKANGLARLGRSVECVDCTLSH